MRLTALLTFLVLTLVAIACIREPRGAARHPLLVQSAITMGDVAKSNSWFSPCPLGPQNLPPQKEVKA